MNQPQLPRWLFVPAVLGAILLVLPLIAVCVRINFGELPDLLLSAASLDALWLSLRTSTAAMVACVLIGLPLAMILARFDFPGRSAMRAVVLVPLVLPPVVGGLALLYTFGRQGLLGKHFEFLGTQIAFSTTAVVIAQTFVALPFLVLGVEGALRANDSRFEVVGAMLGAPPNRVFWRITVPLIRPALISGAVLSFARALGEFGATLTFAGSLQGRTRTLPLEIYLRRESDADAALALSLVLIVIAVLIVVATRPRAGAPT